MGTDLQKSFGVLKGRVLKEGFKCFMVVLTGSSSTQGVSLRHVQLFADQFIKVEPVGDPTKVLVTKPEQLYGNPGHKVTLGLLVKIGSDGFRRPVYGLQDHRKTVLMSLITRCLVDAAARSLGM